MITNGTTHDVKVAPELVEKLDLEKLRSYVQIRVMILNHYESKSEQQILEANIPRKSNTQSNNNHMDWNLYKIRHLVENTFARLKQFRGIATRYDKLKRNYENAVALACIYICCHYEMSTDPSH
ncbi:transposase [Acinetobacter ursingii]|uniref:Transposase n=1 Tax=Acinetobacter ursingii TaxID=108980 RepID=A0AA46S659_9GAMM|nr:transposase [Acinetobacter ursingii]UYF74532.1 transposase [Acinetobacter ursingii]